MRPRRPSHLLLGLTLGLLLLSPGCGRKKSPRPPKLVRPQAIMDLGARSIPDGIRLTWSRPTKTVGGDKMPDLDGVKITRALEVAALQPGELPFEHIATILLDDRGRFNQIRQMSYEDRSVVPGINYFYRVQAFTLDHYFGEPSQPVRAGWPGQKSRGKKR